MSRSDVFSAEEIMDLTSNGYDIFVNELGRFPTNKNISSPLRTGDQNPSFRIKESSISSIWIFKDYGASQDTGNAISFVQKRYNLTYGEAINKIVRDLGLKRSNKEYKAVEKKEELKIKKPSDLLYEFEEMKFKKEHHSYWNAGCLTEDFLRKFDVYACSKIAVNKKVIPFTEGEICFVYVAPDINKMKFLRIGPNVEPKDKWRTNIPNSYLWSYYRYTEKVKQLFVAKSYKDELVNRLVGIESISTQSENDVILDQNIPRIYEITDVIILNFGADEQGANASINVSKKHGLKWFNTPKNLLEHDIEDNFDYVKNFGLKAYENLLRVKKFI